MKCLTLLSLVIILIYPPHSIAAKKECADLLIKFHNIQSKQRQGHSFKKSVNLREQEDKARERWWDCENNRKPRNKRKKKKTSVTKMPVKLPKTHKHSTATFSSNTLVMKGKYSGEKQSAWLAFYKRPSKCARPKTTQFFAYCLDYKEKQQLVFEQQYKKTN